MSAAPGDRPHDNQKCAFCQIIRGEGTASIVFEDSLSLAFLDHQPLFPGHCLLVPKAHYETLVDLPASLVGPLFQNAQLLERAIEEGLTADGTFVALNNRISQSVPHVHIHLVPRHRKDGLKGFFWPRQRYRMKHISDRCRTPCALLLPGSSLTLALFDRNRHRAGEQVQKGQRRSPSLTPSHERGPSELMVQ